MTAAVPNPGLDREALAAAFARLRKAWAQIQAAFRAMGRALADACRRIATAVTEAHRRDPRPFHAHLRPAPGVCRLCLIARYRPPPLPINGRELNRRRQSRRRRPK